MIVGLGNPGKRYEKTRHNFGELVVREMAHKQGWSLKEEKSFQALLAQGSLNEERLFLCVPTTYMNASGYAVKGLMEFYKIPRDALIVVSDDIALEFGTMRLKAGGSSGGHNGLKSIEEQVGTSHYARLRMGIGSEDRESFFYDLADYVLSPFSKEEMQALPALLDAACTSLEELTRIPIQKVMERVNDRNKVRRTL